MNIASPKISIIVPAYNAQDYLTQCLDSLTQQTLQAIEIICVNDGSTDNSLQLLQVYADKDPRIKVINQPNAGPAAARNKGLSIATAPYIMFCDSDDWYEPAMCASMLSTIEEQQVDMVVCDANTIKENKEFTRPNERYHRLNLYGFYQLNTAIKLRVNAILWNKIFKKDIIERYSILFPTGYEHDDASFVFQYVAASHSIFGLEENLYNYRLRVGSLMHQTFFENSRLLDRLHVLTYDYNYLIKNQLWQANIRSFLLQALSTVRWCLKLCSTSQQHLQAIELMHEMLKQIDFDALDTSIKHLDEIEQLEYIKEKKYELFLKNNLDSTFDPKSWGWQKVRADRKVTYYLLKVPFLKIIKTRAKTYIRFLGIPVYRKIHTEQRIIDMLEDIRARLDQEQPK